MNNSERVKNLQDELKRRQIDLFLIHDPLSLYYFTSLDLSAGRFVVTQNEAILIVDRRYGDVAKDAFAEKALVAQELDLELKAWLQNRPELKSAGIEGQKATFSLVKKWENLFSQLHLQALDECIFSLRMIKSAQEIELLKNAGRLTLQGVDFIKESLKPNITEKELSLLLKLFFLQQGADGIAFEPIIAFGTNTAYPHHRPTDTTWKKGDAVQIDIGAKVDHYSGDFSRFILPDHHPLEKYYSLVQQAQEKALALCKPGVKLKELDKAARDVFNESQVGMLFGHSLGHGIGLEVHEAPFFRAPWLETTLQEGMTLTIEPGLYQKGFGGVRLEETIVIVSQGFEICA